VQEMPAVAHFMTGDFTHLLFLDADIEFQVEDIVKMLVADEKVIGAAYAQKWLNLEKMQKVFQESPLPEHPMQLCTNHSIHAKITEVTEKIEVDYLTTGCMLIERGVIETLMKAYPERKYKNDIDGYFSANQELFYNLFWCRN